MSVVIMKLSQNDQKEHILSEVKQLEITLDQFKSWKLLRRFSFVRSRQMYHVLYDMKKILQFSRNIVMATDSRIHLFQSAAT